MEFQEDNGVKTEIGSVEMNHQASVAIGNGDVRQDGDVVTADDKCQLDVGSGQTCPTCGSDFQDGPSYQIHCLQHQLENPFKCAICDRAFSQADLLTAHVRQHQVDLAKKSLCKISDPLTLKAEDGKRRRGRPRKAAQVVRLQDARDDSDEGPPPPGPALRRKSSLRLRKNPGAASVDSDANETKSQKTQSSLPSIDASIQDADGGDVITKVEESDSESPPPRRKVKKIVQDPFRRSRARFYACTTCPRTFISKYHLNMHCSVCDGSGKSTKNNRRKERAVPSTCDICNKVCISQYHLELHKQKHGGKARESKPKPNERIGCSVCMKTFKDQNALRIHMIVHSNEKNYRCPVCDRRFARKHSLELHRSVHSSEMPYSCDVCSARFRRKDSVLTHKKRKHKDSVPASSRHYYCDVCKDYFQDPSHHKTHDQASACRASKVICELCGNLYSNNSILREHVLTVHQRIRRYECRECGQKFLQSQALKSHLSVHSNERPYLCHTCGKSFRSKKVLDRHNESHIPEKAKQMICEVCSKAFTRRTHLTRHMKVHDPNRGPPERKFSCARCDRTFTSRRYLRDHEATHYRDSERPYKCDVCGLRYGQELELQRHLLEHDGRRNIPCCQCGKNFKSSEQYHFHLRSIHNLEPDPRLEALVKSPHLADLSATSEPQPNLLTMAPVVSLSNDVSSDVTQSYDHHIHQMAVVSDQQQQQASFTPLLNDNQQQQSIISHQHQQQQHHHHHHHHQIISTADMGRPMFQAPSMPGVPLVGAPVSVPGGTIRPGAPPVNGRPPGLMAPVYPAGYWVNFL